MKAARFPAAPGPDLILSENVRVHREEAPVYEHLHAEIYNRFEQRLLERDLKKILAEDIVAAVDLGPGVGNIALRLLEAGLHITAVDISAEMLSEMRKRTSSEEISFVHQPIDDYLHEMPSLPPLVTMSSFLHQLPDPFGTLERIASRIPPGGWIYLTHEPTGLRPKPTVQILALADRLIWRLRAPRLARIGSRIDYSVSDFHADVGLAPARIQDILAAHGFEICLARLYFSAKSGFLARIGSRLGGATQCTIAAKKAV